VHLLLLPGQDARAFRELLIAAPELADAALALGEGGGWWQDGLGAGADVATVATAARGHLQLELETRTPPSVRGVRAMPAAERLARALARLERTSLDVRPGIETLATGRALLRAAGGLPAWLAGNDAWLADHLRRERRGDLRLAAGLAHDCRVARMSAAPDGPRVPAAARARVVCRATPGTTLESLRDRLLLAIDDPRVQVRATRARPATRTAPDEQLFALVRARLSQERTDLPLLPHLADEHPPLSGLRAAGVPAFGVSTLRLDREERASIDGPDERVRTRELEAALPRWVDLVVALAAM
jgi:acetylornithine deacetylase/succinyl-diaminopimelate desuccinylase-like protein